MSVRPRLLLVGDDITLLHTREMILGASFAVEISARFSEALDLLRVQRYEVIVILQPTDDWKRFAGFASRQIPPPKIIAVTAEDDGSLELGDAVIRSSEGPYALVKMCAQMAGTTTKAKSEGFKKPVSIS